MDWVGLLEQMGQFSGRRICYIHTELYGYSIEAVTNKDRWRG
jgi:hypothetical protein